MSKKSGNSGFSSVGWLEEDGLDCAWILSGRGVGEVSTILNAGRCELDEVIGFWLWISV